MLICPCYLVVSPCSLSKSYWEIYLGPCGCRQQDALRDANILVLTIECTPRYSSRTRTKRLVGSRAVGSYTSLTQICRTSGVFVVLHTPSFLLKDPSRSRPTHTHIRSSDIGPRSTFTVPGVYFCMLQSRHEAEMGSDLPRQRM